MVTYDDSLIGCGTEISVGFGTAAHMLVLSAKQALCARVCTVQHDAQPGSMRRPIIAHLLVMAPRRPGASAGRYIMMPTQVVTVSGSAEYAGLSTDALAALHRLRASGRSLTG